MHGIRVIGLTGGVGSGKSYIARMICTNFPILHINTDDIARRQMKKGGPSYEAVLGWLGSEVLLPDGEIDRGRVASIVFEDEEKLEKLNSLTHPPVLEEVHRIIGVVERGEVLSLIYERPVPYIGVLVETAILKEAGYDSFCDEIWYVRAPKEQRIGRLIRSRGYSREKAESILASQADEAMFESYATAIIDNPDGIEDGRVLARIRELISRR